MNRKKNSIRILAAGMEQFEAKQQQADFSTLETFLSAYLNTPGRKQRKQLAEEFQKRHLELHQFLKSHPDLLTAETFHHLRRNSFRVCFIAVRTKYRMSSMAWSYSLMT